VKLLIDYANKNNIILNINDKNKLGNYPLLWSIGKDNSVEITKLLIDYANKNNIILNINDKNKNNYYPLLQSIVFNNVEMVKLLMDYANKNNIILKINEKNIENMTQLNIQDTIDDISEINIEIIKVLKENKDKLYDENNNHNFFNFIDLFEIINKINMSKYENEALIFDDSRNNNKYIAKFNLQKSKEIRNEKNEDSNTPLPLSCQHGNSEEVKILINELADINSKNEYKWPPLHMACKNGNVGIIKLLLDEEAADINSKTNEGKTPLHIACEYNNKKAVELLLENQANEYIKDNNENLAIHIACKNGDENMVKEILKDMHLKGLDAIKKAQGSDQQQSKSIINEQNAEGWGLLHMACKNGSSDIVQYLLENGANIELTTNMNETPLYIACENGHLNVVKMLLEHHANIQNKSLNKRMTVLHIACKNSRNDSHKDIVSEIIRYTNEFLNKKERKAFIDLKSSEGWSALHYATYFNNPCIVQELIDVNANYKQKIDKDIFKDNMINLKAKEIAYKKHYNNIEKIIKEKYLSERKERINKLFKQFW